MKPAFGRNVEVEGRHDDKGEQTEQPQDCPAAGAVQSGEPRRTDHVSTALPRSANMPCGRFWIKTTMKIRTAILASTAPCQASSSLFAKPRPSAAYTVPATWPTPPSTTTMNESTM